MEANKTSKSVLPAYLVGAITWFGYHCGAGFASGRQVWLYANRYGKQGLLACAIAWLVNCAFIFVACEYGRIIHAKSYRDLCQGIYVDNKPKFSRVMLIVWDVMVALTAIIACGSCVAGCGTLLRDVFDLPYMLGCLIFVIVLSSIICFAQNILRSLGKVGIPLTIIFFLICFIGIFKGLDNIKAVMTTDLGNPVQEGTTLFTIVVSGLTYAMAQSSFFQSGCIISGAFNSRKETIKFIIAGFILNFGAMTASFFSLMAFYPEIGANSIPTLGVVQSFGGITGSILSVAYNIVLTLAYITTAGALLASNIARYDKLLSKKINSELVRRLLVVLVILSCSSLLSTIGLDGILTKGNQLNASLRAPIWVIPILVLGPFSIRRELKKRNNLKV